MSTITILAPRCPFATFALYELEAIISLFASAPEGSRPRSTLPALIKFLERGKERMTAESGDSNPPGGGDHFPAMASIFGAPAVGAEAVNEARKEEDQDHLALLGWTTRLVKSLKGKKRRGISISHLVDASGSSNGEPSPDSNFDSAAAGVALPISDSDLASLSSTMSWFNSALPGDATLTGTSLQSHAAGSVRSRSSGAAPSGAPELTRDPLLLAVPAADGPRFVKLALAKRSERDLRLQLDRAICESL
jgi:hypothetical protein